MPDVNPNFQGDVRVNGKWGQGVTAATLGTVQYLQGSRRRRRHGHQLGRVRSNHRALLQLGQLHHRRCAALPLRAAWAWITTVSTWRCAAPSTIGTERLKFTLGIDGSNLTNHTTFGNNAGNNQINVNVNSNTTFGTLNFASADPRDFQFSGRISF